MAIAPLQLPTYATPQSLDFTPLADLGKIYQESQQKAARQTALSSLGSGGGDLGSMAVKLAQAGDLAGATSLSSLAKNLAAPEQTDAIKNYKFAVANGFRGTPLEYETAKAAAGATRVNTNVQSGEKAYDTTLGKEYADRFIGIMKTGQAAPGAIANLDLMDKVSQDPNFYSGAGGETVTKAKRIAASLGITDADSAAPNELFQKLARKTVLDSAGGSLGAGFSNADRDFLQGTVANIGNTPEGNRQIISISRAVQKRNQEIAGLARDYVRKNGGRMDVGFDATLADYAEKNPIFKGQGAASAPPATTPRPPPPASTTPRQAPDGKFYVPDPARPGKYLQVQP